MIWDPHNTTVGNAERSQVVAELTAQIEAICGKGLLSEGTDIESLAKAVEHFLKEDAGRNVFEAKYLVLLASRALMSIGEEQAAKKLLLFGTGLVKPSEWEISRGGEMWILDLKQITLRTDSFMELVFFNSLNVVLESTAEMWDGSGGRGILGLQHVCKVASALFGQSGKKMTSSMTEEIRNSCERKLEQIRDQRGWQATPEVMNLDL